MVRIEGELVSLPVMGKDLTHRLQHVRPATCVIVFHSPYHSLSLSRLHCFVELRAFQWQESSFFFFLNSAAWSDTDARTFLELAAFPSGRPAHSSLLFSIFNHPLLPPKSFTLLAVLVKRESEKTESNVFPRVAVLLFVIWCSKNCKPFIVASPQLKTLFILCHAIFP